MAWKVEVAAAAGVEQAWLCTVPLLSGTSEAVSTVEDGGL